MKKNSFACVLSAKCFQLAVFVFLNVVLLNPAWAQPAQKGNLSGRVLDEKGISVPGVTISVKGQQKSTLSDAKGNFSLKAISGDEILVVYSVGYERREIPVNNKRELSIVLKAAAISLEEVVVSVGYGTQKKSDVTGSVGMVNMQDLIKAPTKSVDEALAGRLAGVVVSSLDGQPGANTNIVIRGAGSLTQSTAPLYVVDGFPLEDADFNSINPGDVETIDVLKDASATAIYGARGSNGVVIITTKRGKAGKPQIGYNTFFGISQKPESLALMNAYDFVKYQRELNSDVATALYFTDGRDQEFYRNVQGLDLQDKVYQSSPLQNHQIFMRGGSAGTTYSISGNIVDQSGIVRKSGFERYQGRVVVDQVINKRFKAGINLNYSAQKSSGIIVGEPGRNGGSSSTLSLLYSVWGWRPVFGANQQFTEDQLFDSDAATNDFRVNPIQSINNERRIRSNTNLNANAYLNYSLRKDLTLKVSGGITSITGRNEAFYNSNTSLGNPRNVNGSNGYIYLSPTNSWLNENTLTYNKTLNKIHKINAVAGITLQRNNSGTYGVSGLNTFNEELGVDGLDEAGTNIAQTLSSRWSMMSFLGRVNYTLKNKYLFTGTIRNDGSSKFREGNRWSLFPAGAFAWKMSDESFIKNLSYISEAKLRLSYGLSGNNRVPDFPYLTAMAYSLSNGYAFDNSSPVRGAILDNYGNPNLVWETTAMTNIGYDLGLFKNRITLTADIYRKVTRDVLLDADIPYGTGLSTAGSTTLARAFKNIGKLENRGLELTLNSTNINRKNFLWSSNFNISFNKNKVLSFNEGQSSLTTNVRFDGAFNNVSPYIARLGMPVGMMYGLIWDGVYTYEDFNYINGSYILKNGISDNGQPAENIKPGDIKYRDINGDLKVNDKDFTIIGRGIPIHTGGFSNNFKYKDFDLNVFLQWSYGNDLINANRLIFEGNALQKILLNQYASFANRWSPENPDSDIPRTGGQLNAWYSSRVIEDGSYLRLKTVSLGYSLKNSLLAKAKITSLRMYVSGQNLATWTNYSGQNPDVSVRSSILTPGFDYSAYPLPRTFVFGLNLTL